MSDEELVEPKEEELPPKPLGERLATDAELEAEPEPPPGDEVPVEELLPSESAAMDDTVDDEEDDQPA